MLNIQYNFSLIESRESSMEYSNILVPWAEVSCSQPTAGAYSSFNKILSETIFLK